MATAAISMPNNSYSNTSISSNKQFSLDCLTKINDKGRGVPIFFVNFNRIVIGRTSTNSIWIDSENVSRNHAVLMKCENHWQIKDTSSTNGVYINNNQITPKVYYKLVKGDVICLGPPNICNFKFVLNSHDALSLPTVYNKVPCCISSIGCIKNVSVMEVNPPSQLDVLNEHSEQYDTMILQKSKPKVPKIEDDILTENDDDSEAQLLESNFNLAELISKNEQLLNEKDGVARSLEATNAVDKIKELESKLRETTDVAKITQKLQEQCELLIKDKEAIEEQLVMERCKNVSLMQQVQSLEMNKGRLEQNIDEIRFTLLRKNERLAQEKMEAEMRAKQQIADALNTQIELQKEYDLEKEKLTEERIEGEKNLLQQLEDMRKELQKKCRDADNLSSELLAYNMSNDQAFSSAHRQITAVMDVELVCSICSEFFIKTVTLGCTHSFCNQCINAWKREKRGCPICRADIQIEVNCVIIDNFIENMVLNFSPDEKKHREKIKESRAQSQ